MTDICLWTVPLRIVKQCCAVVVDLQQSCISCMYNTKILNFVISNSQIDINLLHSRSRSEWHTGNSEQHYKQAFPGLKTHLVEDYFSCSYAFIIGCIMFSQGDDVCSLVTHCTHKPEAAKTYCGLPCHFVVYGSLSLCASRL